MAGALTRPRRELDDAEEAVVRHVSRSLNKKIEVKLNYRALTDSEIEEILRRPAVVAAIHARTKSRIRSEMLPAALEVLDTAMRDEKVPWRERISAAKAIIDQSGVGREEGFGDDRPLADMTPREIMAFARAARDELAARQEPGEGENQDDQGTHPSRPLLSLRNQERGGKPQKRQLRGTGGDSVFD